MRVSGTRADGAVYLVYGGGLACILKGDRISPTVDCLVVEKHGPWTPATDNSFGTRRLMQAKADLAHVVPLAQLINLGLSFDETRDAVQKALRNRLGYSTSGYPMSVDGPYIVQNGLGDDWVVYSQNGKNYGLSYGIDESGVVDFDGDAVEVRASWESLDGDVEFPAEDDAKELRHSPWFKNFMADKRKKKLSAVADA